MRNKKSIFKMLTRNFNVAWVRVFQSRGATPERVLPSSAFERHPLECADPREVRDGRRGTRDEVDTFFGAQTVYQVERLHDLRFFFTA